jgi:hypothetical protein
LVEEIVMDTTNLGNSDSYNDLVPTPVFDGQTNVSEYIAELLRTGQREKARLLLEAELLKGVISGPPEPWTDEDLADIRAEVLRRHEARKAGK